MTSLSRILKGEEKHKTSYIKEVLTELTDFLRFFFKDESPAIGLIGVQNRNEVKND